MKLLREADRRNWRTIVLALAVAAVAGTAAVAQARFATKALPRPEPLGELTYYPSGAWLSRKIS